MSSAFIEAAEAARRSISKAEITDEDDTIKEMMVHVNAALDVMKIELQERMEEALLATLVEGGKLAAGTAKAQHDFRTAQVVLAFDAADTAASAWAKQNAATMVKGTTAVSKKAMQEAIAIGFEDGIAPKALGKNITNMIALSEFDAAAVSAVSAQSGPAAGAALGDKLLKRRANVIARTETIRAANAGQAVFWQQAVNEGLLTGLELREWIVTPDDRLCEICEPMEGQRVGLNDEFETGDGGRVHSPPAHPQCRCAVGLTDKTDLAETGGGTRADVGVDGDIQPSQLVDDRSYSGHSSEVRETLAREETSIMSQRFETLISIDPETGETLFKKDGEQSNIPMTTAESKQIQGSIITHNHPSHNSFSNHDIIYASENSLAEMRAVVENGDVHRMWGEWPDKDSIENAWNSAEKMIDRVDPDPEQFNRFDFPKEITTKFADDTNGEYLYKVQVAIAAEEMGLNYEFIPGVGR